MLLGRSVLLEVGRNFLAALGATTAMAFFVLCMTFLKRTPGIGVGFLADLMPLFVPEALQLTVPLAMLTATVLTVGRMAGDGELTALAAAGLPARVVYLPILAFAAVVALGSLLMTDVAAPFAQRQLRAARKQIPQQLQTSFRAGLRNLQLGANRGSLSFETIVGDEFHDICIEYRQPDGTPRLVRAERGSIAITPDDWMVMRLERPRGVQPHSTKEGLLHFSATDVGYALPIARLLEEKALYRNRKDLLGWELAHVHARNMVPTRGVRFGASSALEQLARRGALAAAALFFCLVGISLGLRSASTGGIGALLTSVTPVLVIYFPIIMAMSSLAKKGKLPAYPALWLANFIAAAVGLWMLRRASRI
ncbi:MAG: LptF/LptG family permease [Planctomycetota bacterium]